MTSRFVGEGQAGGDVLSDDVRQELGLRVQRFLRSPGAELLKHDRVNLPRDKSGGYYFAAFQKGRSRVGADRDLGVTRPLVYPRPCPITDQVTSQDVPSLSDLSPPSPAVHNDGSEVPWPV